ncbi:MAG: hypothetical protein ACRDCH_01115 [Metamycoplasmataceae bacterium]
MISNFKKLALGIISTGGILVPLVVVTSCGSKAKDDVNLTITAKTNPTVTQQDIEGNNYKSLATLQKLFNGITTSNFDNLTAEKQSVNSNEYFIVLTAKDGYLISGQKTLQSAQFKVWIDLLITAKTNPIVKQEDIDGEQYKSLATLEKIFDGITASDLANITVTKETIGSDNYIIVLKAKDGYRINGQETLNSTQFILSAIDIEITAKPLATYEIKEEDVDNDAFKSYATLQKLFAFDTAVVTEELLDMAVVITMTPMIGIEPRVVRLTVNMGYAINGMASIDSNEFVIPIDYLIERTDTVPTNITLNSLEDPEYIKTIEFLNRLFVLGTISQSDIDNYINVSFEPISGSEYKVILTSKSIHVKINGQTTFESNPFIVNININVTRRNSLPQEISTFDTADGALGSLNTLRKLFIFDSSITQTIIDEGLIVEFIEGGSRDYITLTAKTGYIINNGDRSIQSVIFTQRQGIPGASRESQLTILTNNDITGANLSSHKTINNFFSGITDQAMINSNMSARLNTLENGWYTITLIANSGKLFAGGAEITSIAFQVTAILNVL